MTQSAPARDRIAPRLPDDFWAVWGMPLAVIAVAAAFAVANPRFLTFDNILLVLQQSSIDAIAAIGLTMILICGVIDISQGSVMALSAAGAAAAIMRFGWPEPFAIAFGLGLGAVVGAANGVLTERARVPAFIATLATLFIVRGIVLIYLGGQAIPVPASSAPLLHSLATGRLAGIPVVVILTVLLYIAATFALRRTSWGLRTYAVGSSVESASRAGIRAGRHRMSIWIAAGTFSALAGLVLLGRIGAAPSELATGREFYVITAAIVGGTSVYGGRGTLWRTFLGAFFIALLANGLVIANVNAFYQQIAVGVVLVGALVIDRIGSSEGGH